MHPLQGTSKESYWLCDACGKKFKGRFGLELHVKNKHKKEFIYTCKVCYKAITKEYSLGTICHPIPPWAGQMQILPEGA